MSCCSLGSWRSASLFIVALGMGIAFREATLALAVFQALERLPLVRGAIVGARQRFAECDEAARAFFRVPVTLTALPALASTVCWVLEAAETWLVLQLLAADVPFGFVVGMEVAVSLGRQILVLLPAGVGLQEAGYWGALAAFGLPHPLETAAALSVLKRGKELGWGVVGFSLLASFRRADAEDDGAALGGVLAHEAEQAPL